MLLFAAVFGLLRLAAGDGELVVPGGGCPEGYKLFGTGCLSTCPPGSQENFLFCNTACDDMNDPLCVNGVALTRRRNIIYQVVDIATVAATNVRSWTGGFKYVNNVKYLKDKWGRAMPTVKFLHGKINADYTDIRTMLGDLKGCAKDYAKKWIGDELYDEIEEIIEKCASLHPYTRKAGKFMKKFNRNIGRCSDAKRKIKELGSDVQTAMVLLLDAAGSLNSVDVRRRLEDHFEGARTTAWGTHEIPITLDRLERMANDLLKTYPGAKAWDPVRRRLFVEEQIATYMGMLRQTPDDEDDVGTRRRVDLGSQDAGIVFSVEGDVNSWSKSCTAAMSLAVGENLWEQGYRAKMNYSWCWGRTVEVSGTNISLGAMIMEIKDVAKRSKVISFGADYPGAEFGCAINVKFINNQFKGVGASCGGGSGVNPVSLSYNICDTWWMDSVFE